MNSGLILAIVGAAAATYLTRFPLMLLSGKKEIPGWLVNYMKFIAPAVLTSLIVPAILIKEGRLELSLSNNYIIAAIITAVVSCFSKNMLISLVAGICTVGILTYIS